ARQAPRVDAAAPAAARQRAPAARGGGAGGAGPAGGARARARRADPPAAPGGGSASTYDQTILADGPVAYWAMSKFSGTEPDLTGNNHTGTYHSGTTTPATMPNGDKAADFNGSSEDV